MRDRICLGFSVGIKIALIFVPGSQFTSCVFSEHTLLDQSVSHLEPLSLILLQRVLRSRVNDSRTCPKRYVAMRVQLNRGDVIGQILPYKKHTYNPDPR